MKKALKLHTWILCAIMKCWIELFLNFSGRNWVCSPVCQFNYSSLSFLSTRYWHFWIISNMVKKKHNKKRGQLNGKYVMWERWYIVDITFRFQRKKINFVDNNIKWTAVLHFSIISTILLKCPIQILTKIMWSSVVLKSKKENGIVSKTNICISRAAVWLNQQNRHFKVFTIEQYR